MILSQALANVSKGGMALHAQTERQLCETRDIYYARIIFLVTWLWLSCQYAFSYFVNWPIPTRVFGLPMPSTDISSAPDAPARSSAGLDSDRTCHG